MSSVTSAVSQGTDSEVPDEVQRQVNQSERDGREECGADGPVASLQSGLHDP